MLMFQTNLNAHLFLPLTEDVIENDIMVKHYELLHKCDNDNFGLELYPYNSVNTYMEC